MRQPVVLFLSVLVLSPGSFTERAWAQAEAPAMPNSTAPSATPVAPATPSVPQGPGLIVPDGNPVRNGFALSATFGLGVDVINNGQTLQGQPFLRGGLAVGYKLDRIVFSLGVEFFNLTLASSFQSMASKMSTTMSTTAFLLIPGIQVALFRSRDRRFEVLGAARFGFGRPVSATTMDPPPPTPPPTTTDDTTLLNFMYEVAPGLRYWPHRHFSLNLLAGFRGDYMFQFISNGQSSAKTTNTAGTNGIFASIGGLGVF